MNELWKMKCKADLFNLRKNEAAILSIPEEIDMERDRMTSIKSASTGTAPVQGGGTSEERRILEVLYIDRQKRGAERLCQELAIAEEATVWKRAMRALENYCAARYSSAAI